MKCMTVPINTTSGDTTVIVAQPDHHIVVVGFFLVVGSEVNVWFEDGLNGTKIVGQMNHAANGGIVSFNLDQMAVKEGEHLFYTAKNTLLNLAQSGTAQIGGLIRYYIAKEL